MNVDDNNKNLGEPKSIKKDEINLDSSIKKDVISNPIPSSPASAPSTGGASGLPTESKLPENNNIDTKEVGEEANPGDNVGKGKEVGEDGKVQKSAGREIVDAGQNAAEVAAAVGSGGASAGAGAGAEAGAAAGKAGTEAAGKAGAEAGSKTSNAIKNAGKKNSSNPLSNKAKEVGGKVLNKAKDELADKIDKKAEKNPLLKKGVENIADKAKTFNRGVDAAKSVLSGDIGGAADNLKQLREQVKKMALKKIKRIAITIFLYALVICILIMSVWAFIEHALAIIDKPMTGIANTHEKLDNFLNGLGFQNSEDAFYDELVTLVKDHDYQVNVPIVMATLFYDDTHNDDATLGLENTDADDGGGSNIAGFGLVYKWLRESNDTLGRDGLVYSSNKIYRLRKLVRNQFDSSLFGNDSNHIVKEVTLSTYIANLSERIGKDLYDLLISALSSAYDLFTPTGQAELAGDLCDMLFGEEVFTTTDFGSKIENIGVDLWDILKAICSQFGNIEDVGLCENNDNDEDNGIICVKYYQDKYDEDTYIKYLKDYYIRYMPEFKKYINASNEETEDEQIEKIIAEIKETSENYQDVFGRLQLNTTENYTECVGNIKESLLGDLGDPVTLSGSVTLSGTNAFGTVGGKSHNGVELNGTSAGVSEGAEVYSVMDGEVLESTADDSYSDKNVKGGWLKIKYKDTSGDEGYIFDIIYGGMSKDSVTLKKNDKVTKGQVIGKVGSKDESEHGDEPGLHFGFYDESTNIYMNPTNIFVPCSGGGDTCETFKVHDTYSISESNFKTAVETYCSSHDCASINSNWDLSTVYKAAVSNDLNPMFAVARAFCEGFSPGSSKNNYWGIGCYNNCNSCCTSYSSLSDGVAGLANLTIVSNATYMYDIFSSGYASLGGSANVWLNPGNWSAGGCVYLDSIKPYLSESGKAHAESACATGVSGVQITDEENKAYYLWNCEKTMKYVTDIFGSYLVVYTSPDAGGTAVNVSGTTGAAGKTWEEKLQMVFPNGVPQSSSELESYLTTVECETLKNGTKYVQVHKTIAQDVVAACESAKAEGFNIYDIGGYRKFGSDGAGKISSLGLNYSQHCYGLAVDINPTDNGQFKNGVATGAWHYYPDDPAYNDVTIKSTGAIYKSFTSNGWGWGGEWNSSKDYMHFSFFGY